MFECCPFTAISILFFFPPKIIQINRNKNIITIEKSYHRQTSSSSSFFFRFPLVSFIGVELIVGLDSFFGVTFSCLTFAGDALREDEDADGDFPVDDGLTSDVFSFFTVTGVDVFCGWLFAFLA